MSFTRSSLWTKTVAVGVVAVSSVVGNASLSASGLRAADPGIAPMSPRADVDVSIAPRGVVSHDPMPDFGYSKFDPASDGEPGVAAPASETPDGAGSSEQERLIPAIYAWDPDVRFVFYRHVSKWM